MNAKLQTRISKRLSLILRHKPESIGITLDENGWANVQNLLNALNRNGARLTLEILETVVAENPKKRFEFNDAQTFIRARQGHSIDIDLGYSATMPPDVLYHGTAERFLDPILKEGLIKQQRHHVHMSTNIPLMLEVARRRGKAALLEIDAKQMHQDGHEFYVTENEVWLTDRIPTQYLTQKGTQT
ncbi:MAG: RNA 2'-phosphotransferase [Verrucomicrobiota bacterium]